MTGMKEFIGTQNTFLFSLVPKMEKYGWKDGNNEYFLSVGTNEFSFGAEGCALHVGEDWDASSLASATFNSPPLNGPKDSDRFEIVSCECFTIS